MVIKAYRNPEKCKICGGKCCKIYDNDDDGIRDKNEWFDEWCENFHSQSARYGVEPSFDPLVVHMAGHEVELNDLLSKGINPMFCQYLGVSGCKISWEKRPLQCVMFKCEKMTEDDVLLFEDLHH